jgi:cell division septal protein FtsQ
LLRTSSLDVAEVTIRGVHLADQGAIEKIGKRALGCNIILLRKSPMIRDIAALPEVGKVTVGRRLPRNVWINVYERKPDAVLTDGGGYCLIRSDGLMFHKTDAPLNGVPLIEVEMCDLLEPGNTACKPHVQYALRVMDRARKKGLKTAKISVDRRGDMCLNMGSDFYVKFGQPDDIAQKMLLLRSAVRYKPSLVKEALYIDLSCPSAPVWKPRIVARAAS